MRIWTVANQKGGVGKTTTAVALVGLLATQGHRTLLLDLDPQGSLSSYFRCDPDTVEASSYAEYQAAAEGRDADPSEPLHDTGMPGLSLIPASTGLATLDRQSASRFKETGVEPLTPKERAASGRRVRDLDALGTTRRGEAFSVLLRKVVELHFAVPDTDLGRWCGRF